MANILHNRVSATLTPEQVATVKTALQQIREALPFLIGLTTDERQTLPKMNIANRSFTEDALNVIDHNPGIFPPYLDLAELRKDLQLYDQLGALVTLANQLCELMRDTQILAGSEAYVTALTGYKMAGAAASSGVPGAKTVYDLLKKRFEGQGTYTAPVAEPAPAPATA